MLLLTVLIALVALTCLVRLADTASLLPVSMPAGQCPQSLFRNGWLPSLAYSR